MSQSSAAWAEVAEQFNALGSTLKDPYAAQEGAPVAEAPTQDELKEALRTLGDAATAALGTVGEALKDPTIKAEIRATAGSLVNAVGVSVSELGADISAIDLSSDNASSPTQDQSAQADDASEDLTRTELE
ncbi:MAG: hypothetical protein ACR2NG_08220 [Acidimicrobiia bacterium]